MNTSSNGDGPLDGITVVEAGSMIAGPTVGRILADFGASVIKVEDPDGGDHLRNFGAQSDGVGLWWKLLGRNKLSVTLDLSADSGHVVFRDLIREADVLIENFRPGTMERWDLGPDALHAINPGLVMLRISGFGQKGPYATRPGFGTLAEAMSAFAHNNGFPDRPPLLPPTGLADGVTALYGTFSVMFALYHRDVNGGDGQVIDASLVEPVFSLLGPQALVYDTLGEIPTRSGNQSTSSSPRNVYETADGRYVAISASAQPLAMRVLEAIERPDLKDDARFATNEARLDHRDELDAIIADWMADHTREEVIARFEDCDATLGPVYDVADVFEDPHYQERELITSVEDDALGEVAVQNVHPRFETTPGRIDHLGPALGSHNHEVYRDLLGYDAELVGELEQNGVI